MSRILIRSGMIVSMDDAVGDFARGDILIQGDKILAIAPHLDAADAEVIDGESRIVMPGFVNAHLHTWQTGLRGVAGDWTIGEYLHNMHASIAPGFRPDDIYVSNLVGALNQINSGTTTLVDWCHNNPTPAHSERAIDGLQESGIRAVFLHGSPKPDPKPGQKHFSEIPHPRGEITRLRRERLGGDEALVTLGMAILGPAYSTYAVTQHDVAMARELGMLASMHVGGGAMLAPDGFTRLIEEGLVGEKFNIVHGNNIPQEQLQRLVDRGANVTVTPEVELQMGFGDPLTGRLRALGARPSIGSDVESSIGGDMFTCMRTALQSQRALDNLQVIKSTGKAPQHVSISCREALAWATINGAAMAGLGHRVGSLAPGKQADIVLLRADDLNLFPVVDPVRSIVLHAGAGNVDTVLVAGRVVKRAGKLVYAQLPERMAQLAEASHRITSAIGAMH